MPFMGGAEATQSIRKLGFRGKIIGTLEGLSARDVNNIFFCRIDSNAHGGFGSIHGKRH